MMRAPTGNPNRPWSLSDSGEQTRVDYWKDRTEVLPRELLEITGWLGRRDEGASPADPEREVTSEEGGRRVAAKASQAPNAVFRIPPAGPLRERWAGYLEYLRKEQQNRWLKEDLLAEALAEEGAATAEVDRRKAELAATEPGLSAPNARVAPEGDPASRCPGAVPDRAGIVGSPGFEDARKDYRKPAETRHLTEELWLAQQRLERVQAEVRWRRTRNAKPHYVGLHGEINAFLDLQALSVASLASEELRRRPPPTPRPLLTELEAQLEADE
jgi:hypothetical protein